VRSAYRSLSVDVDRRYGGYDNLRPVKNGPPPAALPWRSGEGPAHHPDRPARDAQGTRSDPEASAFVSATPALRQDPLLGPARDSVCARGVRRKKILVPPFTKAARRPTWPSACSDARPHGLNTRRRPRSIAAIRDTGYHGTPNVQLRKSARRKLLPRTGNTGRAEGSNHPALCPPAVAAISLLSQT